MHQPEITLHYFMLRIIYLSHLYAIIVLATAGYTAIKGVRLIVSSLGYSSEVLVCASPSDELVHARPRQASGGSSCT